MEIKSIVELISPLLDDGRKFVSSKCKPLLSNGENFGSIMLDLKVTLSDKDGKEEIVNCVAKTCPPTEILWHIFNVPVTVKKEIALYKIVVPTLKKFAEERGIDNKISFFANYYGARLSLDPNSDKVDADAVLLLENVTFRGFRLRDRFIGFNMEEAKLILRNLALFHAVPLAHKLQKPEEFKEKIQPYLKQALKFQFLPDMEENITSLLKGIISTTELAGIFPSIQKNFRRYREEIIVAPPKIREPFATLVHNDFWINNTMLRYENYLPIENIMVDFQAIDYNSPTHDLLFFLYTSIELSLVENNLDEFIKYYYNVFIETLKKFGCQTDRFTFEDFMDEMGMVANEYQLYHIIMMLQPVYLKKEEAPDLSKLEEVMGSTRKESFHENFHKKIVFIVSDFHKRGWI